MRSSAATRLATALFAAVLVVGAVAIAATSAKVEYFGPVLVFDGAMVTIFLLLFAPTDRAADY